MTVTDEDGEENGNVACEVEGSSHPSLFKLNEISEKKYQICFSCNDNFEFVHNFDVLDRERQPCYYVIVKCSDNGQPSLYSFATLVLAMKDINDNTP
ncbi:hypothetical protein HELRODRAFT_146254, partial [Helobdella robusta]|uniref:Cadherin domain-containing protein n=1 Tax=Helobdella robusta TaxID=6412 RepID=T1EJR3_HELRO